LSASESRVRPLRTAHGSPCRDQLRIAPLWVAYDVNLGTLLRTTQERTIVLLGHEGRGIPPDVLECVDTCVEIPMRGVGHSLNVAVAGSLVAYRLAGLA
jgi:tRNA C32,U32 (ribose-2'-O)-methylase TrmJ